MNYANESKLDAATGTGVRVRRARVAAPAGNEGGVVSIGADDFAQLEECMTQSQGPNERMIRAAEMHRALTTRR